MRVISRFRQRHTPSATFTQGFPPKVSSARPLHIRTERLRRLRSKNFPNVHTVAMGRHARGRRGMRGRFR